MDGYSGRHRVEDRSREDQARLRAWFGMQRFVRAVDRYGRSGHVLPPPSAHRTDPRRE